MFLKRDNQGSALVIAIFVIVVMTVIGAALVRMLSTSAETIAYEVLGTRAYNAAQIGLQWRLQQVFPLNEPAKACNALTDPKPALSTITGLENCTIASLNCVDEQIAGTRYYTITSTGQCNIAGVLTSRTLEVQAREL
ncbi:pilus assembly PilX N-terminal domain-containing protein [Thalassotalea sp. G2M2-11]|uniref:pilus assembly PilX N-terminal domain-containing protein n=1 Tax=Thalassotalea sp. G2M2-11 TaxID=2787627 RepID=UPI0019D2EB57|nr:pilus assembly PilX N-terminal domain-containing protein [Thalassotalea sp. G2M2-11]